MCISLAEASTSKMETPLLKISSASKADKITEILKPLVLSEDVVSKIIGVFEQELELGMAHGLEKSSLQMENTFVPEMTNGTESGRFLALDLGGTNFRSSTLVLFLFLSLL